MSAKIQYSYDVPTIGLQNVNTTGTVAGTSITGKPSTLTSYEPITITNTQSSATPSPFQQMINFTSSDPGFSSISTGNFGQNLEFFYYNGTVIPSWLESYTSNYAIWWLKIAAIPAGSSETIYVGFAPTLTNLFNTVNDGEAPQLTCPNPNEANITTSNCPEYGKYDDGLDVFLYYNNFSTRSDASYYNNPPDAPPNATLSIDDSLHIFMSNISNFYGFMSSPNLLNYYSFTTYVTSSDTSQNTTNGVSYDWQSVGCGAGQYNQVNLPFSFHPNIYYLSNYFVTLEKSVYSYCGNAYIELQAVPGTYGYVNIAYVFANSFPPNGVMPSVSFGSIA